MTVKKWLVTLNNWVMDLFLFWVIFKGSWRLQARLSKMFFLGYWRCSNFRTLGSNCNDLRMRFSSWAREAVETNASVNIYPTEIDMLNSNGASKAGEQSGEGRGECPFYRHPQQVGPVSGSRSIAWFQFHFLAGENPKYKIK